MGRISLNQPYQFRCQCPQSWDTTLEGRNSSSGYSSCERTTWTLPGNGWHEETYSFDVGKTKFVSGKIASGISITQSFGSFEHEYHSSIIYDFPVAVLGFGIRGANSYVTGNSNQDGLLRPGDVFLYRPDGSKTIRRSAAQQDYQSAALKFDMQRITDVFDELIDLDSKGVSSFHPTCRLAENLDVRRVLKPLLDNPLSGPLDRLIAESTALSLLATSLEAYTSHTIPSDSKLTSSEHKSLSRAIDLLLSDLSSPPDLNALAAEAGMSHTRLNRCFKKAYGCTVFVWLRHYRLDIAKKMLQQDRHSITEIAFLCGFSSASHFGASFRSQYGYTPQEFRQLHFV